MPLIANRLLTFSTLLLTLGVFTGSSAQEKAPCPCEGTAKPASAKAEQKVVWKSLLSHGLDDWEVTRFGGEGEVLLKDKTLIIEMGHPISGVTYKKGDQLPKVNYELSVEAKRVLGNDFFCGLTFPIKESHCTLILGGWGGSLTGVSSINGSDASENETSGSESFKSNQWYQVRVVVKEDRLEAWVDQTQLFDIETEGLSFDTRIEMDLSKPLGLATFETEAHYRNFQYRLLK